MDFETKNSVTLARIAMEEALFHLHDTGEYESEELDGVFKSLTKAKDDLLRFEGKFTEVKF